MTGSLQGDRGMTTWGMNGEGAMPVAGDDCQDMVEHGEGGLSREFGAWHSMQRDDSQSFVMEVGVLRQAHDGSQDWEHKAVGWSWDGLLVGDGL